jgi:hypothetical protein
MLNVVAPWQEVMTKTNNLIANLSRKFNGADTFDQLAMSPNTKENNG